MKVSINVGVYFVTFTIPGIGRTFRIIFVRLTAFGFKTPSMVPDSHNDFPLRYTSPV